MPFDKFHWTRETVFDGYTLRESREYAQAIITRAQPYDPFYGAILTFDQPTSGPCQDAQEAADWVIAKMKEFGFATEDAEFAPLPIPTKEAQAA